MDHVPVTGSYSDGPEWGEQPYTNMFASDLGSLNPTLPVNTLEGKILKEVGGSVLGAYGYSISPSSSREAVAAGHSFVHAGGKVGVVDTSLAFGTMDFTSQALIAKQQHVNALFPTMIDASNFALASALKQAGVRVKAAVFARATTPRWSTPPSGPTCKGTTSFPSSAPSRCPTPAPA
jgi:branched-chain amino acid transport system substrate-binding protein